MTVVGPAGADAMGPVDGLVLDGRVPPAVEEEDVVGELQVQAHRAGPIAHQDHVGRTVVAEPANHAVAPRGRDLAVILQRPESPQGLREPLDRRHPLAEDDRLASAAGDLLQVGFEPFQLRAGPGGGVEVADLFQPQHQLEDVLDGRSLAHLGEADDAFLFGQAIGLALLGRKFQLGVAK